MQMERGLFQDSLDFDNDSAMWREAFERWRANATENHTIQHESSLSVYKTMWDSFSTWCMHPSQSVGIDEISVGVLERFHVDRQEKNEGDLSPRYWLRMMRLIERVHEHRSTTLGAPKNGAMSKWVNSRFDVKFSESADRDPLPEYLSDDETQTLIHFLLTAKPQSSGKDRRQQAWQEVRNKTAAALQLGAGLAPGDIRFLTIESPIFKDKKDPSIPWKLRVPENGNSPSRETQIANWAGDLLAYWLEVRVNAGTLGPYLFASTRSGRDWSKPSYYVVIKQIFNDSGIELTSSGSFRLRHTFALRQLQGGHAPEEVARWLGVRPEAMDKYKRIAMVPKAVV